MAATHPLDAGEGRRDGSLFLSIDAGCEKYRATVLDEHLEVVWTEQVNLDLELPQYSTKNGVHTLGDRVSAPSEMRLAAVDLLLEKLARHSSQAQLIPRIVAISGAGQPGLLHFLTPQFDSLLAALDSSPSRRIANILTQSDAFSVQESASVRDSSTMSQVRKLEQHFGNFDLSPSSAPSSSRSTSSFPFSSHVSSSVYKSRQLFETLEKGREYFARTTGSKVIPHYAAAQLLKIIENDQEDFKQGETSDKEGGVLGRTGRIVTESQLLSAVFLGKPTAIDLADACATNLFNLVEKDWDMAILDFLMEASTSHRSVGGAVDSGAGGGKLRQLLGDVSKDCHESLGKISAYLTGRYGFSSDTIIVPFTNSDAATFLSYPLRTSARSDATNSQRDTLISLTSLETDSLFIACPQLAPQPDRQFFFHPARTVYEETDRVGGENMFVAMLVLKDAGLGRSLSKDLYCNGSWDVFTRLVAIVPLGGSLGLDGKQFSMFFPHGQGSSFQGFLRFVGGVKVPELPDRKATPRLIVESQLLSLRIRLSQLYSSLESLKFSLDQVPSEDYLSPYDPLGFSKLSNEYLPTRIVLVGTMSINPVVTSILSTVFGAPTYLLAASGLKRSSVEGMELEGYHEQEERIIPRKKTSAAALGAGYRAAWVWQALTKGPSEVDTFESFLEEKYEAQEYARGRGGIALETSQAQLGTVQAGEHDPFGLETYPPSSGSTLLPPLAIPPSSQSRGSSSVYTLASSSVQTFSHKSSLQSSATSPSSGLASTSTDSSKSKSNAEVLQQGGAKPKQNMYDPKNDEPAPKEFLEEDPAGLNLVALPDEHEFEYYASMMPEYVRLEKHALKGLI